MKLFNMIVKVLDRISYVLVIAVFITIIMVVLLQVFARFVLPSAPVWTEELSRYLFMYLIVLASGIVIRQDAHVKLELFQSKLSPNGKQIYNIMSHLTIAIFSIILIPYAWQYAQIGRFQTSPALYLPMNYIFVSTVIFFALNAFYCIAQIILSVNKLCHRQPG